MLVPLSNALRAAGLGALVLLLMAMPAIAAQGPPNALGDHDLGSFIREGSCDEPGTVIEDIGDLDQDRDAWTVVVRAAGARRRLR